MCLEKLDKYKDHGILLLRLGTGLLFTYYGYGKLMGGAPLWEKIGGAVGILGITSGYQFFGLLATLSEFVGGLCLIFGFCTRIAAIFMLITMGVAVNMLLSTGAGMQGASHPIQAGVIFLSLIFIGSGRFSVDAKCGHKK